MTDECPRAGKLFGGCKFEARHDRAGPSDAMKKKYADAWEIAKWYAELQIERRTYVHDVCVRCGKTVKR